MHVRHCASCDLALPGYSAEGPPCTGPAKTVRRWCREGGHAEQPATPPLFTRRRQRSGTGASADPATDRSHDPVSTAAAFALATEARARGRAAPAGPCSADASRGDGAAAGDGHSRMRDRVHGGCDTRGAGAAVSRANRAPLGGQIQEEAHGEAPGAAGISPCAVMPDVSHAPEPPSASTVVIATAAASEGLPEESVAGRRRGGRGKGKKTGVVVAAQPAAKPAKHGKRKRAAGRRRAARGGSTPAQPDSAPPPQAAPNSPHATPACPKPGHDHDVVLDGTSEAQQLLEVDENGCAEQRGPAAVPQRGVQGGGATAQGPPEAAAALPPSRRRRARQTSTDPAFAITPQAGVASGSADPGGEGAGRQGACDGGASPDIAPPLGVACNESAERSHASACVVPDAAAACVPPAALPPGAGASDEKPGGDREKENDGWENGVPRHGGGSGGAQAGADGARLLSPGCRAVELRKDGVGAMPTTAIRAAPVESGTQACAEHGSRSQELAACSSDDPAVPTVPRSLLEDSMLRAAPAGAEQDCRILLAEGGSAGAAAAVSWEACATPEGQLRSSMLGPGFVSASELLESQRSGRALSSGGARSTPDQPAELVFVEPPDHGLVASQHACPAEEPDPCLIERLSDGGEGGAAVLDEPPPASIRGSEHPSIDCSPAGVEQGHNSQAQAAEEADVEAVAGVQAEAARGIPVVAPTRAPDAGAIDLSGISQWTALTGATGTLAMVRSTHAAAAAYRCIAGSQRSAADR